MLGYNPGSIDIPRGLAIFLSAVRRDFRAADANHPTFLGKGPFKGGAALEADWNGRILWEVRQPNHHHDGRLLKNGNVLLLCATELARDVSGRVQGGRPGTRRRGGEAVAESYD